jgi:hypothetical protein
MNRQMFNSLRALAALFVFAQTIAADVRITVRHTENGRTSDPTVIYIKGSRQRDEFTGVLPNGRQYHTAFIFQCDLKRILRLDLINHQYAVADMPFRSNVEAFDYYSELAATPGTPYAQKLEQTRLALQNLPVVTATTVLADTGERREMFGYTARRIKGVTTWTSDASCDLKNARFETDGWYIDLLYGLECSPDISGAPWQTFTEVRQGIIPPGKCGREISKDRYRLEDKTVGAVRLGFPLLLTETFRIGNKSRLISKREVIALEHEDLDAALFEPPADYKQTQFETNKR